MNLSDIITKCYILALIIRDDGERLLLGDGIFEFKNSLQHFAPNIYQNDIVELQGTDGQLLAGQVRRSATQAFDGYIADGTIGKTDTEQSRRRFLGFFRKKHHYKVVYIMPDGTAVQRDRGYIVDAPAVQELYQRFPEYHIGLNFEDPNYYEYSENDEGEEIYTHIQAIALFRELEAGLVWDAFGAVSDDIAWTEYMTKNSTDGYILIGNGLPVEAPLSLTHLYGNAEQKTLSGKNLFSFDIATLSQYPATGMDFARGANDITITATGTTGAQVQYATFKNMFDSSKTYTLSGKAKKIVKGTDGQPWLVIYWRGSNDGGVTWTGYNNAYQNQVPTQGTEYSFDSSSNVVITGYTTYQFLFYNNASNPVSMGEKTTYYDIQLEQSNQATTYEPYCGGIPSPNPDFPQEVKTVTGAQTVKITGKNILPTITGSATQSGVSLTSTNGTITASGTATANMTFTLTGTDGITYRQAYWQTITASETNSVLLQKGTYYLGAIATLGNISAQFRLADLWQRLQDGTSISLNSSFTITEPKRLCITIYVNNNNTPNVSISDLQLELGTQRSDYEPYQAQSQELNLGKNLFDTDTAVTRFEAYNGNAINDWGTYSNGIVTINKSNGADGTCAFAGFKPTLVEGQTYTLSATVKLSGTSASNEIRFGTQPNSPKAAISGKDAWIKYSKTFTATATDVADSRIDIQAWNTGNTIQIKDIQLEVGSQASSYVAYKTPIELAKIGTYQDYIWNNNGTWKIHKEVGKVVLDGTETVSNIDTTQATTTRVGFWGVISSAPSVGATLAHNISNYFVWNAGIWASDNAGLYTGGNDLVFRGAQSTIGTTEAQVKTWLASHNVVVYYPLATPIDTEITDSELIAQLNHIYELYQGTNNLWLIPSAGAQGEMTVRFGVAYDDDGSGYHWSEELGSPDNIISNDGIDSVRPIWTINGPATNPSLTNITTAQTITWNGTVPADSTLTIDMERQTATLNGANVYAQIEGDWLELAVGPNKLQYTASGGATADSTLEWNGVAG